MLKLTLLCGIFLATPFVGAEQPKFEAASVKRTERCAFQNSVDPGMIALHGDSLKVVLMEAFAVKMDQIVGPSWLDSDCFAIDAKVPQGATKDQIPAMLQVLLIERFKLAAHKESQLRSGYALVLDKKEPKFSESDPNSPSTIAHAGQVTFGAGPRESQIKGSMTMAALSRFVSNRLGVPVEDLTSLKGKYDIDISWVPDRSLEKMGQFGPYYAAMQPNSADDGANLPTGFKDDIFTSFRNSLGLRLDPRKEPVEMIVIDYIEQIPTEN